MTIIRAIRARELVHIETHTPKLGNNRGRETTAGLFTTVGCIVFTTRQRGRSWSVETSFSWKLHRMFFSCRMRKSTTWRPTTPNGMLTSTASSTTRPSLTPLSLDCREKPPIKKSHGCVTRPGYNTANSDTPEENRTRATRASFPGVLPMSSPGTPPSAATDLAARNSCLHAQFNRRTRRRRRP